MKKCIDVANLRVRLKKIVGQVQGIDRMIDQDAPCEDVLTQISAAKAALNKVGQIVLEEHINHCIKESIERGDSQEAIESFKVAVERFVKMQ